MSNNLSNRSAVENSSPSAQKGLDLNGQKSVNGSMSVSTNSQQTNIDPFAALAQGLTPKRAVSYLRVSTTGQANRGGREEGFSIPAQRDYNRKKAESMGAKVVKEFVERGVSGTSTNRPALQAMLTYLEEEQDNIDYLIVHKIDRLARNRADDAILTQQFERMGIRLVSTSENIDATPGGMLLHGIMSSIAEFYSRNLSNEVIKGMTQKVKSGGSVGRAPLGYLNVREFDNGVENRTVAIDPDRAPLVKWAFEAYATGQWTTQTIVDELCRRGLTTVATPRMAEKPVTVTQFDRILINPFYTGVVRFRGAVYPGNHEPLIDQATFDKVQTVRSSKLKGERSIKHNHYLKSSVYCGKCNERLIYQEPRNKAGNIYQYYACAGRHGKRTQCDLPAIPIWHLENLIEDLYQKKSITKPGREELQQALETELEEMQASRTGELDQLHANKTAITRKQEKLLEAHYNDAIPLDLLKREQTQCASELAKITQRIDELSQDIDHTKGYIATALQIAEHCAGAYQAAEEPTKRQLNQVFFERIDVYYDDNQGHHVEGLLNEPFNQFRQRVEESPLKNEAGNSGERKMRPKAAAFSPDCLSGTATVPL